MNIELWFRTKIKSFILALLLISFFGSVILLIIKRFRFKSVFIIPSAGLLVGFASMIIYPMMILPLFYEIKTIDNPVLEKKIIQTSGKAGVNIEKIYVIKESRYSNHTNAFFTGFGESKKIYLYDTLIMKNSEEELLSILSHEIGHWVYNHNAKGVFIGSLLSIGVLIVIYLCMKKVQQKSGFSAGEIYSPSRIPLYLLLIIIILNFTGPIEMFISRKMEANADRYALELTKGPDAFIKSQVRIARDNNLRLNRHPLAVFFRNSHPATISRIRMAEEYKGIR